MLFLSDLGKVEDVSPTKFKITATYNWAGHREPINETTEIDMTIFMGSGLIPRPDMLYEVHEIKNELKVISKTFNSLQKDLNKYLSQNNKQ